MKHIILYVMLLVTSQAQAWVISADFENGVIGSKAKGNSGLSEAFKNTRFTNSQVRNGKQAAVSSIKTGETGFGKWGGRFVFPTKLGEGDEIWYRVWVYYPTGFSFKNNGVGVKTLRIHTQSPGGGNEGYFDMLTVGNGGVTVSIEQTRKEFQANNEWRNIGPPITTGTWHAFEQYAKLSSVSGKGAYRAWVDGKLVMDDTTSSNLKSSGSKADFSYIWSYFNGGSSQDQKAYIDDVIITNEPPSSFDSQGNRFIGAGNENFTTAPPNPPTIQ